MVEQVASSKTEASREKLSPAIAFPFYNRFELGPAWRWRKAQNVAARRTVSSRVEWDSALWHVVDHLAELPREIREIHCGDGTLDVAAAEVIFRNPLRRMQIEARLLAGLSPEVVATRCGLNVKTVQDYCQIFFDILDSLDATSWLAIHIFAPDDGRVSNLHSVVCRDACKSGPAVCEYWLARVPYLGDECDLTTKLGREVKGLQLTLQLNELQKQDSNRLCEVALLVADLPSQQPICFTSLSEVIRQRAAQQLGDLLVRDEDAPHVVQIENDSHIWVGDSQQAA